MTRYEKMVSNIKEVKARDGIVISVVTTGDHLAREASDHVIELPPAPELLVPLLEIIPLQLLAYHVATEAYGDVIGEQLERDDFQQGHEQLRRGRKFDDVIGGFPREMISRGDNGDDDAVAGLDFLDVGNALLIPRHCFGVGFVTGRQDDDGQIFVDQGVGAVLHFAGGIAFGVNVRDFLELQRAFESDGVVNVSTEIEKIGVAKELPRQVFVESRFIRVQNFFDFLRDAREFLHQASGGGFGELAANLAEIGSEQKQGG